MKFLFVFYAHEFFAVRSFLFFYGIVLCGRIQLSTMKYASFIAWQSCQVPRLLHLHGRKIVHECAHMLASFTLLPSSSSLRRPELEFNLASDIIGMETLLHRLASLPNRFDRRRHTNFVYANAALIDLQLNVNFHMFRRMHRRFWLFRFLCRLMRSISASVVASFLPLIPKQQTFEFTATLLSIVD